LARRKTEALRLLRGDDLDHLSRELGVTATLSGCRDGFLGGGTAAMKSRPTTGMRRPHARDRRSASSQWTSSYSTGGASTWRPAVLLRRGGGAREPLRRPGTGRRYGLKRVWRIFGMARSTAC
jgi:hypothetical protein